MYKKIYKKRILWMMVVFLILDLIAMTVKYNDRQRRLREVAQMGGGINIGNSLDVVGLRKRKPQALPEEFEVYWGNPKMTPELFQAIAEKGFGTVRIPVSFAEHMDERGIIEPVWLERVAQVVDWALETGLYVIIDTHHEEWLVPTVEREEEVTAKLCTIWEQLAEIFREKGDHLLFEGMNEPRVRGTKEEWEGGTAETREVVNRLNEAFVRTVRRIGGNNEQRWLLVAPYGNSYQTEALEQLKIPEDDHIIVSVHAYIPYHFTLDDDGEKEFDPNGEDAEKIDQLMEDIHRIFYRRGIPVMITEFGCHEKPDENERLEWAEYYIEAAGRLSVPCIWWDNGKNSQIVNRETFAWPHQELTECLLKRSSFIQS